MKLYVATLLRREEDHELCLQHHVANTPLELAIKIDDALKQEEKEWDQEIPHSFDDILMECDHGNVFSGPLSIGVDTDLSWEYLLFVSVEEL